jgi:hypothetical protein
MDVKVRLCRAVASECGGGDIAGCMVTSSSNASCPHGVLPPDVLMQVQDLRRINVAGFMTEWGGVQHFADAAADKQFCRCRCGR